MFRLKTSAVNSINFSSFYFRCTEGIGNNVTNIFKKKGKYNSGQFGTESYQFSSAAVETIF